MYYNCKNVRIKRDKDIAHTQQKQLKNGKKHKEAVIIYHNEYLGENRNCYENTLLRFQT